MSRYRSINKFKGKKMKIEIQKNMNDKRYDYDLDVYGSKIEMIEQIKNKIVRGV